MAQLRHTYGWPSGPGCRPSLHSPTRRTGIRVPLTMVGGREGVSKSASRPVRIIRAHPSGVLPPTHPPHGVVRTSSCPRPALSGPPSHGEWEIGRRAGSWEKSRMTTDVFREAEVVIFCAAVKCGWLDHFPVDWITFRLTTTARPDHRCRPALNADLCGTLADSSFLSILPCRHPLHPRSCSRNLMKRKMCPTASS
jgi:hypothetical protein